MQSSPHSFPVTCYCYSLINEFLLIFDQVRLNELGRGLLCTLQVSSSLCIVLTSYSSPVTPRNQAWQLQFPPHYFSSDVSSRWIGDLEKSISISLRSSFSPLSFITPFLFFVSAKTFYNYFLLFCNWVERMRRWCFPLLYVFPSLWYSCKVPLTPFYSLLLLKFQCDNYNFFHSSSPLICSPISVNEIRGEGVLYLQ